MAQDSQQLCQDLADQYRTLLEVAEAISTHRDLSALCQDLIERLPRLVPLNFIAVDLHDGDTDEVVKAAIRKQILEAIGSEA